MGFDMKLSVQFCFSFQIADWSHKCWLFTKINDFYEYIVTKCQQATVDKHHQKSWCSANNTYQCGTYDCGQVGQGECQLKAASIPQPTELQEEKLESRRNYNTLAVTERLESRPKYNMLAVTKHLWLVTWLCDINWQLEEHDPTDTISHSLDLQPHRMLQAYLVSGEFSTWYSVIHSTEPVYLTLYISAYRAIHI